MPKEAAGCLLYRYRETVLEVLLVHPSGNYNRKTPWGIPKGGLDPQESHELAARRETQEETGVFAGELTSIGFVVQGKSKKQIHCFAGPAPADANPTCASWEVDCSEFVSIEKARQLIHPDQEELLNRLQELLK